ncbi:hypothetical protein [Brevundimonas sp.]|uniref:hypothetical protein n=1 Tax=Brevundimonas sp. TaxID=1871086 RepID=UPI002D5CBF03|nr:hypothetical protein [Brevundimonas sp.]HYC66682.1 hypothetical protein [Brevundimonas sp.]
MTTQPITMPADPPPIPNATPFDLIVEDLGDLLLEAKNWCDGEAAETQEQVDEIARLIDALKASAAALEDERVREKRPLDDQIAAIQDRYNVYLAPLKNKKPGKVPTALDALNAAKRPFLLAREAELEAARQKAREEAEAAALAAAEAAQKAAANDLGAREEVEIMIERAEAAAAAARAAEKEKAHAHGGGRAQGLRTRVVAEITDLNDAVRFYWAENREAFAELVQSLADTDARQNRRAAEGKGVAFREERY